MRSKGLYMYEGKSKTISYKSCKPNLLQYLLLCVFTQMPHLPKIQPSANPLPALSVSLALLNMVQDTYPTYVLCMDLAAC